MTSKLLTALVLGLTGVGAVWAESNDWLRFPLFGQESPREAGKKISAVKPKFRSADQKKFSDTADSRADQYTFFAVLNDPSLSKIVGLDGEIVKKGHSASIQSLKSATVQESSKKPVPALPVTPATQEATPTPVTQPKLEIKEEVELARSIAPVSVTASKPVLQKRVEPATLSEPASLPEAKETSDPALELKKALEEFEKLLASPGPAPVPPRASEDSPPPISATAPAPDLQYAVQVSSFRKEEQAHALKNKLMKKGYSAFVKRIELPGNKGIWYRVYMGRYIDRSSARDAASRFEKAEKLPTMVVRQAG